MEFPTTEWSLLAQATLNGETSAATALDEFCRRYRGPVLNFIRGRGVSPDEAEDLTHEFLLHVMEKSTLRRADAAKGRFRSFLIGALVRFLRDRHHRKTALKRGGPQAPMSLDGPDMAADAVLVPPDDVATFDREWAHRLLELALEAVRLGYEQAGRAEAFAVLRSYLPGVANPPPYEASAARLSISTGAMKTEVHRLRERFRSQLQREVAFTVNSPEQIEAEFEYLGRVLNRDAT